MLTQENRKNLELIKEILYENKTISPPLRNQDRKKAKVETEKVNKLSRNIPDGQRHWSKQANLSWSEANLR